MQKRDFRMIFLYEYEIRNATAPSVLTRLVANGFPFV